ncbi:hypothetical protein CL656_02320 [bacterium]|nr:hypothetical protein [bacterium]|tara:strand:+ start:374 stop:1213 length:840 start_codon:yes stop_codon:yes gene_type:complete
MKYSNTIKIPSQQLPSEEASILKIQHFDNSVSEILEGSKNTELDLSNLDFQEVEFTKQTIFEDCNFNFSNLEGVDLTNCIFIRCTFKKSNLKYSTLGTHITCDFTETDLEIFHTTHQTHLIDCKFIKSKIALNQSTDTFLIINCIFSKLQCAPLDKPIITPFHEHHMNIEINEDFVSHLKSPIEFEGLNLSQINLSSQDLKGFKFKNCVIQKSNFKDSKIIYSEFINCDLSGTQFEGAQTYKTVFGPWDYEDCSAEDTRDSWIVKTQFINVNLSNTILK